MNVQNIPTELQQLDQWLNWRKVVKPGLEKPMKFPLQPSNPTIAVNYKDASTWGTFEQAIGNCDRSDIHGVGFAVSLADAYVAIDLDDYKRDAATVERSKAIIEHFSSYTEVSPSGNGCHIFIKADKKALTSLLSGKGYRKNVQLGIEILAYDRYCTLTGVCGRSGCRPIEYRQAELEQFISMYFPQIETVKTFDASPLALDEMPAEDREVWRKMFTSRNGDTCFAQYKGEWQHHSGDLSLGDWSFIQSLCYWCNGKPEQIKRMALQSGMKRAKWFEARGQGVTWLDYEIQRAIQQRRAA